MKQAILVTPIAEFVPEEKDTFYIGIDAGALKLLELGLPLNLALGDFDSCSEKELEQISRYADEIRVYPKEKDETDTELALYAAASFDQILLCGAIGKRLDHTMANLSLMIWKYPQLRLQGDGSIAFVIEKPGISLESAMKHVSFFPLETSVVSLSGFEYSLERQRVQPGDIFMISNRVTSFPARVSLQEGRLLCIQSEHL